MRKFAFDVEPSLVRHSISDGAARLNAALQRWGYPTILPPTLCEALDTCFGEGAFEYGNALKREGAVPSWTLIRLHEASRALWRRRSFTLEVSRDRALAGLLEDMDMVRVFADEVTGGDEGRIDLRTSAGSPIASIEGIVCEEPDLPCRHRVEELLKGTRSTEEVRIAHRLSSLPGLTHTKDFPFGENPNPDGIVSFSPDNLCWMLREMLAATFAINLKVHQTQELLAALLGISNWQHLIRDRDEVWNRLVPTACVIENAGPGTEEVTLHRSPADAVCAFARWCSSRGTAIPVTVDIARDSHGSYPLLQAFEKEPLDPAHTQMPLASCFRPALEGCAAEYLERAAQYLSRPGEIRESLLEHFGVGKPMLERHRLRNRRAGVLATDELWLAPWLMHVVTFHRRSERLIVFEKLTEQSEPVRHEVFQHESWFKQQREGWHLLTEYGHKQKGLLDGLADREISQICDRFDLQKQ